MKAQFTFLTGTRAGQTHIFSQPQLTIGRHPDCDIKFDPDKDLDVSSRHASVILSGEQYILRDLGSTNGTYIHDQPITGDHHLGATTVIRFGAKGPELEFTAIADRRSSQSPAPDAKGTAVFGSQPAPAPPPPPAPVSTRPSTPPVPQGRAPAASSTTTRVRIEVERQTRGLRHTTLVLFALLLVISGAYFWQSVAATRRLAEDRQVLLGQVDSLVSQIRSLAAGSEGLKAALDSAQIDAMRLQQQLAQAPDDAQMIQELRDRLGAALRQQRTLAEAAALDARRIATENRDAVALVFVQFPSGAVYTGTAFAVRSDAIGGLLVTNRHVVIDSAGVPASKIGIVFEGTRQNFRADIVKVHPGADVALIRASVHRGFPVVRHLADSTRRAEIGEPVAVLGFPLGLDLAGGGDWAQVGVASSLTLGTVSRTLPELLQVEGYGAQGSSGSPIFDKDGTIIAVLYGGQAGSNGRILYGVPVRFVHQLLEGTP